MGKTAKVGEHMSEEFVIIDYEDRYKPELLAISLPWLEENDILGRQTWNSWSIGTGAGRQQAHLSGPGRKRSWE